MAVTPVGHNGGSGAATSTSTGTSPSSTINLLHGVAHAYDRGVRVTAADSRGVELPTSSLPSAQSLPPPFPFSSAPSPLSSTPPLPPPLPALPPQAVVVESCPPAAGLLLQPDIPRLPSPVPATAVTIRALTPTFRPDSPSAQGLRPESAFSAVSSARPIPASVPIGTPIDTSGHPLSAAEEAEVAEAPNDDAAPAPAAGAGTAAPRGSRRKKTPRQFPVGSIAFIVAWSVAIVAYHHENNTWGPMYIDDLLRYAIIELSQNSLVVLLYILDRKNRGGLWLFLPLLLVQLVNFGLGWDWFRNATNGYDIFDYLKAFGPHAWLTLPFMILRLMYFALWLQFAMYCLGSVLVLLGLIGMMIFTILAIISPDFSDRVARRHGLYADDRSDVEAGDHDADTAEQHDGAPRYRVVDLEERRQMRLRLRREDTRASTITTSAQFIPIAGLADFVGWFAMVVGPGESSGSRRPRRRESSAKDEIPLEEIGSGGARRDSRDGDDECPVCRERFDDDAAVVELEVCRHWFHRHCIATWFDGGKVSCPLCRSTVVVAFVDGSGNDGSGDGEVRDAATPLEVPDGRDAAAAEVDLEVVVTGGDAGGVTDPVAAVA
ncbi:hypothetical protein HK405_012402, partial [Cladochytrium tenue]